MYVHNLGDGSLSFVFGNSIRRKTSEEILKLYSKLKGSSLLKELSVYDLVPAYCSLSFHFDPMRTDSFSVEQALWPVLAEELLLPEVKAKQNDPTVLPVIYNGRDLERVSRITGLSSKEVVRRHSGASYQVAMIGFRPHFPYLIGLHKSLETKRLDSPRLNVPAGSVAIGGSQTGIYPEDSPGGWNIIGETDPGFLKTLHPGDDIQFIEADSI